MRWGKGERRWRGYSISCVHSQVYIRRPIVHVTHMQPLEKGLRGPRNANLDDGRVHGEGKERRGEEMEMKMKIRAVRGWCGVSFLSCG